MIESVGKAFIGYLKCFEHCLSIVNIAHTFIWYPVKTWRGIPQKSMINSSYKHSSLNALKSAIG